MQIIVGVTGASGAIYAQRLLEKLLNISSVEVSVVFSDCGKAVWKQELGNENYASNCLQMYDNKDFYAPFASGSGAYDAMVICPCSMGTLGRIASGISDTLITRAADVMLKERKMLIVATRETPLNLIHIQNMQTITLAGGIILPLSPSFYSQPQTIDALVDTVIDRIITQLGLPCNGFKWGKKPDQ